MVLGLLLTGCDNFMDSSKITFEKCHSIKFSSFKKNGFDEFSYEINKEKETVIRTTIWSDKSMKEFEISKDKVRKISQDKYKLKSIGNRFVSTDFLNGVEIVFDLENKTVQSWVRVGSDIKQYDAQCY